MPDSTSSRAVFRRRHRIAHDRDFAAVFAGKLRKSSGPITVHALATDRPEHRLGLSVGKRVGGAVVRVRVKRLIRAAFRLSRAGLPRPITNGRAGSYDLVVSVRAHGVIGLDEMREHFERAVGLVDAEHRRRHGRPEENLK